MKRSLVVWLVLFMFVGSVFGGATATPRGEPAALEIAALSTNTNPPEADVIVKQARDGTVTEEFMVTGIEYEDTEGVDTLYRYDGETITKYVYPLGTLKEGAVSPPTGGASATADSDAPPAPDAQDFPPSGLSLVGSNCMQIDSSLSYGFHCFNRYRLSKGDSDPLYWYRIGWWVGSSHSRGPRFITKVKNRNWVSNASKGANVSICCDWTPAGTIPGNGSTKTLSLNFGVPGASASISSSLTVYADTYGVEPGYPKPKSFQFSWWGCKLPGVVIEKRGGDVWKIREGKGYGYGQYFTNTTTTNWCL